MRRLIGLVLVAAAGFASGQVWEKPIAPGLVYRMEVDMKIPRIVHALRFSPGAPTTAVPELAGGSVYEETNTKGRLTVSQMVAAKQALAGINGDYFPYTGDPLGMMIRNGEVLSIPSVQRSSIGWSNKAGSYSTGIVSWRGSFTVKGVEVPLDNVNGECGQNQITLNSAAAGFSLAKTPNVHVMIKLDRTDWSPNGTTTGVVTGMTADEPSMKVAENYVVLVATGNKTGNVTGLRSGDQVTFKFESNGIDWTKVDQLISGGPNLVKDGAISVDDTAQNFKSDFSKGRHPRTAIGRTEAGDFYFVAVDGRQKMSLGVTLGELADVMLKLGCKDAINVDGGGSTDLNVLGVVVNRPSDGAERPIANGVLFYGERPVSTSGALNIEGPASMDQNGTVTLRATEDGKVVGDAEVIWGAQGAAWIDQGGMLRPWKTGTCTVSAWIKGHVVTKTVTVIVSQATKPRIDTTTSRAGDRNGRTKTTPVKPARPVKKKGKGG